jgi:hypothetical protein
MPRQALGPYEAASAMLREAGGIREHAERQAWKQYQSFLASEGEENMATRYWLTIWQAIVERTELPPVPTVAAPQHKRFDANGQVVSDAAPTHGLVLSDKVH